MATKNTKSHEKMGWQVEACSPQKAREMSLPHFILLFLFVFFVAISPASLPAADEVKAAEAARIQAIESVAGAVVAIYGNERQGGGSGVVFDSAGYALTNHHVIAGSAEGGWAGLADGKLYRWQLIGTDPGGDLAIIKLEGKSAFPAAPLGNSDVVNVGDWALAMGNPFNLAEDQRPTVTLGIVSGVRRFQEGSGLNQLVYGNCIQVDSSINPGNSGGPLFNLGGQIIGINGRGSFEERGRVNVGLGYAISSNQIKHFIPELLATKIAQHGTLDAQFSNREAGVICHTLNLDSPAAKAGLALGDKLLAFEETPIDDANQFTNLLSTYPARWPVELALEHEGQARTIHVRLSPLPYERFVQPNLKPREKPAEEQPEKPDSERPRGDQAPPRSPINERPPIPLHDAGKIRDAKLNAQIAKELLAHWRERRREANGNELTITSDVLRSESVIGEQIITISSGARVQVEYVIDGQRTNIAGDESGCRRIAAGGESQPISRGKALLDPHFAQGLALAALIHDEWPAAWGELALDGADKANSRLCYRLSLTDAESSERLYLWLSVFDASGQPHVELVKTAVGLDDDEPIAGTLYAGAQPTEGLVLPARRTFVRGLAESPELVVVSRNSKDRPAIQQPAESRGGESAGDFAAAIEVAQRRTVKVYGAGIGRSAGYATGIIISPRGEILTAQGVYLGAADLRVTLPDGTMHRAEVIRRSTELQAALLKIDAQTPDYFELLSEPVAAPGDWALAISNAFKVAERKEPLSASIGVLGLRMSIDARRGVQEFPYHGDAWLFDSITSNPGAEGGAVVAADGKPIGMIGRVIESKSTSTRVNYAVPADLLARFVSGETPPAIAVAPAPASTAKAHLGIRLFGLGGRRGPAFIDRVTPGGPAAKAGLKTDDLIVSIAGQVVRDASEFRQIVESLPVGQAVVVEVKRKNELLRMNVTPEAEQ